MNERTYASNIQPQTETKENTMKTEMRLFNKTDWYAYAGCENPNPKIGDIKVDGYESDLILDGNFVLINVFADDTTMEWFQMDFHKNQTALAWVEQYVGKEITVDLLKKWGFEQY